MALESWADWAFDLNFAVFLGRVAFYLPINLLMLLVPGLLALAALGLLACEDTQRAGRSQRTILWAIGLVIGLLF